jgi:uncharacterized C2H2 Zn-finger protein
MGCGCKKNKKGRIADGTTSKLFKEQKDYRSRVNEALKQFADLKKRKTRNTNR